MGLDCSLGSLLIHFPVSWLTLRGLLTSWGFVPTGFLLSGGNAIGIMGFMSKVGGVRGDCRDMQGDARLTDGEASDVEGEGRIMLGDVSEDNPLRPPGEDSEWGRLSAPSSSSGGVLASPTLPQLPRLSSDWFPSLSSPLSRYLMHFFLRLKTQTQILAFGWVMRNIKVTSNSCITTTGLKLWQSPVSTSHYFYLLVKPSGNRRARQPNRVIHSLS